MSFREKSAWAMALLMTATGAFYAWQVVSLSRALGETAPPLAAWLPYAFLVVVGAIVAQAVLAALSPREAGSPADERERQIQLKAGAWSGVVLAIGAVGALMTYLPHGDGRLLFHLVAASLIAAQIAEYAIAIVLFRRGV
ncbi:MAG TPA: hypothetical protein VEA79_11585 [Phenylobacterium sp.]|nr:hypothetical protein [Phenylobacterium sp.]